MILEQIEIQDNYTFNAGGHTAVKLFIRPLTEGDLIIKINDNIYREYKSFIQGSVYLPLVLKASDALEFITTGSVILNINGEVLE